MTRKTETSGKFLDEFSRVKRTIKRNKFQNFFLEQIPKRTSYVVTHSSEQEPVIGQRIQTLYRI